MLYALPALIVTMLGFMWWRSAFHMRRDRLRSVRSEDRSKVIMTPKQRARVQLKRAFQVPDTSPEWEAPLVQSLAAAEARDEKAPAATH